MSAAASTNSKFYAMVFEQMANGIYERGVTVVQENEEIFLAVLPTTMTHPLPSDLQLQYDTMSNKEDFSSSLIPLMSKNLKRSKKTSDYVVIHWQLIDVCITVPIFLQWYNALHDTHCDLRLTLDNNKEAVGKQRNTKLMLLLESLWAQEVSATFKQRVSACKTVNAAIVSGHGQIECDADGKVIGYSIGGLLTLLHGDSNSNHDSEED
jgi:hypothetical protein